MTPCLCWGLKEKQTGRASEALGRASLVEAPERGAWHSRTDDERAGGDLGSGPHLFPDLSFPEQMALPAPTPTPGTLAFQKTHLPTFLALLPLGDKNASPPPSKLWCSDSGSLPRSPLLHSRPATGEPTKTCEGVWRWDTAAGSWVCPGGCLRYRGGPWLAVATRPGSWLPRRECGWSDVPGQCPPAWLQPFLAGFSAPQKPFLPEVWGRLDILVSPSFPQLPPLAFGLGAPLSERVVEHAVIGAPRRCAARRSPPSL